MIAPRDPRRGSARRPLSLGGPEVVIAADAEVFDELSAAVGGTILDGIPVVVVRASELGDPDRDSDLYFGRYQPSGPSCVQVLVFGNAGKLTIVEQDLVTGAVYRGGSLVWPSAPLAVAAFRGRRGAETAPGADMAVYFCQGSHTRITTLPDVVFVARDFVLRDPDTATGEFIARDWMAIARKALGG